MCGICGQYNYISSSPAMLPVIRAMTETMKHRGPDDFGYYLKNNIGLGFRRLSIIDLAGGHQPMSDELKSIWIVFNGEIYNFQDLRQILEADGYVFRTNSDTEVIINGYKKWGVDVLHHLNGMFGLAIWDERANQLMLARDRMGIKLVYFKEKSDTLYFASEIRALLTTENSNPDIDPVSLNMFLRYRYTPSPMTIFKGIKKLAPGTRLIIKGRSRHLERWWNYEPQPFEPSPKISCAEEELLELYKAAVKRHLISDVPVGLLLSGGIDSGLLLALMNNYGKSWRTYTVGYGESFKDDELRDAAKTAQLFNSIHAQTQINRRIFEKDLQKIISFLEEPIASSSIVPMYHVCKLASQDVKVALIGQGPDEVFGGYKRHLGLRYGYIWRALPPFVRNSLKYGLGKLPRNETIQRGIYSLDVPQRIQRYQEVFSIVRSDIIDGLFKDEILPPHAGDGILDCWVELFPLMNNVDELGGLQFLEVRSSLPDELLMYADKLSMAHSLELRVPYLDVEIVEYAERLTARYKIKNGVRKWIHKQVCELFLPKEIIRRKKRGFAVNVVDDWFKDAFQGRMGNLFLDESSLMYRYLDHKRVTGLLTAHEQRQSDYHKILFSLVVFEEWLRQYCS
jgi:asparagine synthase (glutamine-hydrolysing)